MCGIAGFTGPCSSDQIQRFQQALNHRGPDERGELCSSDIGLSHSRLSILDLASGRQPIFNEDRTCAIVFNGEIYNYLELRDELKARHLFTTNTDTEVILHLYEEKGTEVSSYLRGDFAFCIWDMRDRSCFLSRDPLGVKPLFYSVTRSGNLVFSSELRAMLLHPEVDDAIDEEGLSEYLTSLYVPAPRTILRGVRKLSPGESLVWRAGAVRKWRYWTIPEPEVSAESREAVKERSHHLLRTAVQRRLIADVPVGAFLSGGMDSSLIVAMASEQVSGFHTFSIGYGEPDFDELRFARLVSDRYGTRHHEFIIEPRAEELIEQVIDAVDEPVADSSTIPTFLISRETRKHVKVALSGVGGDEMFFGYPRYLGARLSEATPRFMRRPLANLTRLWSSQPSGRDVSGWIQRFGRGLSMDSAERYLSWTSFLQEKSRARLLPDLAVERTYPEQRMLELFRTGGGTVLDHIFRYDVTRYLACDLLQLCDNMTMAHSLEARVPFCDVDLVSAMARTPSAMRFGGYRLKPLLREIAGEYLPAEILNRRKQGFMVPIGRWFRSDLRDYLNDQLSENLLPEFVSHGAVRAMWNEHREGRANHTHVLWGILLLSRWLRKNRGKSPTIG